VVRDGKTLSATDKGIHLISVVHPEVKSPAMTGEWEAKLKRMARGDGDLSTFMSGIESFITDVVGRVTATTRAPRPAANTRPQPPPARNPPTEHSASPSIDRLAHTSSARAARFEHSREQPPAPARKLPAEHSFEPPPWLDEPWPEPSSEPSPWLDEPWPDSPIEPWHDSPRTRGKIAAPRAEQPPFPAEQALEPPARASRPHEPTAHSPDPPSPLAEPRTSRARKPTAHSTDPAPPADPPARTSRARKPTAHSPDPAPPADPPARTSRARKPNAHSTDPLAPPADPPARPSRARKATAHSPDPLATPAEHSIEPPARTSRARKATAHSPDPLAPPADPPARPSRARKATTHSPDPLATPAEHSIEPPARTSRARKATAHSPDPSPPPATRVPTAADDLRGLLRARFGFPEFRPYQEAVCRAATLGRDVLLVMPTGAGKSLCYQLPGIARAGTTLIISPLIALMEDQAAKLAAQGFRAERIHSGRSRGDSRQACIDYLEGHLDYLFIAPERLRVPGFPEMLARRRPTLIAIDEAHCISQWGHDFRPDYRTLGQRLPALRPAPIVALTATATPTVQDDIAAQLGLQRPARFIHGFRRTNIAIEVVERSPGERTAAIRELLADPARRPAIVYAATRKSTEELADALGPRLAAAYHAGMSNSARDDVQSAFLSGRRDVIVATTAFGMGIDKPNVRTILHAALPGSLEGYYQEIGRAGRDGAPATAVLLHARVDLKTHEFFHARDYPDPRDLAAIFNKLPGNPTPRAALNKRRGRDARDKFENALEKLIVHGGARESDDEQIIKGTNNWSAGYNAQRAHKLTQLQDMAGFAAARDCRMVHLIRHFGDAADGGAPCGICDVCAPTRTIAEDYKKPSPHEKAHQARILAALADSDGLATGRLHRDNFGDDLDRRSFEHVLGGLVAMGLVAIEKTSFTRNRKLIPFERASLTPAGRAHELTAAGARLPAPKPAKPATRRARKPRKAAAKRTTTARRKPAAKRTTTAKRTRRTS
jgi:DNA topoisomerase-3